MSDIPRARALLKAAHLVCKNRAQFRDAIEKILPYLDRARSKPKPKRKKVRK